MNTLILDYRKKPVVVQAIQLDGTKENLQAVRDFLKETRYGCLKRADGYHFDIHTLEGVMHANPGDYIVKGVQGEFYPVKPDIFEATYECCHF